MVLVFYYCSSGTYCGYKSVKNIKRSFGMYDAI